MSIFVTKGKERKEKRKQKSPPGHALIFPPGRAQTHKLVGVVLVHNNLTFSTYMILNFAHARKRKRTYTFYRSFRLENQLSF